MKSKSWDLLFVGATTNEEENVGVCVIVYKNLHVCLSRIKHNPGVFKLKQDQQRLHQPPAAHTLDFTPPQLSVSWRFRNLQGTFSLLNLITMSFIFIFWTDVTLFFFDLRKTCSWLRNTSLWWETGQREGKKRESLLTQSFPWLITAVLQEGRAAGKKK